MSLPAALRAVALAVLAGAVGAVLWWQLAPRAPIVIRADGGFFVDPDPEQFAASDAWFALLAFALGALAGVVAWWVGRRHAMATVLGLAIGGVAGSFVMRYLGQWFGRVDLASIEHLAVGSIVAAPLRLQAPAMLLALPVAALGGWLVSDLCSDYRSSRRPLASLPVEGGQAGVAGVPADADRADDVDHADLGPVNPDVPPPPASPP